MKRISFDASRFTLHPSRFTLHASRNCWAALAWTLLLAGLALAADAGPIISPPSVTNPIGPPTVPPSSFQSGLGATPNPANTRAGNGLAGSVGPGNYLRGPVPYRSATGFAPAPGSSSLDSFLRYSAGTAQTRSRPQQDPGGIRPFYRPVGASVTTSPGTTRIFSAQTPKIIGPAASPSAQTPGLTLRSGLTDGGNLKRSAALSSGTGFQPVGDTARPVLSGAEGMAVPRKAGAIPGQPATSYPSSAYWRNVGSHLIQTSDQQAILDNIEQYRREMLELQQRVEQLNNRVAELTQGLSTSLTSPQQPPDTTPPTVTPGAFTDAPGLDVPSQSVLQPPGLPTQLAAPDRGVAHTPRSTGFQPVKDTRPGLSRAEPKEWPIQDAVPIAPTTGLTLYDPRNTMFNVSVPQLPSDTTTDAGSQIAGQADAQPLEPLPALDAILRAAGPSGVTQPQEPAEHVDDLRELIRKWDIQAESLTGQLPKQPRAKSRPRRGLRIWRSAQANAERETRYASRDTLGASQDTLHEIRTADRFTMHMDSAESYMQQGKYYRAAEAYTLAAAYKPGDARPHIGKGHALFAAGEYLSSAIYIAQALEADPAGTLSPTTDLVRVVGGPPAFDARLTDLEKYAQAGQAPELKFLLSYVYLRTGDAARAKAALTLTAEHFRAWPAANILRQAINEAIIAPYMK